MQLTTGPAGPARLGLGPAVHRNLQAVGGARPPALGLGQGPKLAQGGALRGLAAPDSVAKAWARLQVGLGAAGAWVQGQLRHEAGAWVHPRPSAPSRQDGLRVVSYNAFVRISRPEQMLQELRRLDADVVALQEADPQRAQALAQALGMHLVWQDRKGSGYGGLALLSRFPVRASEVRPTPVPRRVRLQAFAQGLLKGDPRPSALDPRFVLEAKLQVGDRPLTVLVTHLTLYGAQAQAREWAHLQARAEALRAQGEAVVVAGDFNADLGPLQGKAAAEGNASDPAVARAMRALGGTLQDAWVQAPERLVQVQGQAVAPELAARRAEQASGQAAQAWAAAARGATLAGGGGRIDGILSSGLQARSVRVDREAKASDHVPLLAELDF